MPRVCRLSTESDIPIQEWGGKAHGLAKLYHLGFQIPPTMLIECIGNVHDLLLDSSAQEYIQNFAAGFSVAGQYHIAIRSSAPDEDSQTQSSAGLYRSVIGPIPHENLWPAITDVISSRCAGASAENIGVVIQEVVGGVLSGVCFSSHPLTGCKQRVILSYTEGAGHDLVDGISGTDIEYDSIRDAFLVHLAPQQEEVLISIARDAKRIEQLLGYPIDLEWTYSEIHGIMWLQCRPITSLVGRHEEFVPVILDRHKDVAGYLHHDKVKLRLLCEEYGVHMSPAYVIEIGTPWDSRMLGGLCQRLSFSDACSALSVVVIQPRTIGGEVLRKFCACADLSGTLKSLVETTRNETWRCQIIIQEIYDAPFTGICCREDHGIIIEIAAGHFATKGLVSASTFLLNGQSVLSVANVDQATAFRITGGLVIQIPRGEIPFTIDDDLIKQIAQALTPLLTPGRIVEFGVFIAPQKVTVYAIDIVISGATTNKEMAVASNVVSIGKAHGRLQFIETSKDALDIHYHSDNAYGDTKSAEGIFVAKYPSIELAELIHTAQLDRIGFIFSSSTLLCHLALLLREKGIPACILPMETLPPDGVMVQLDTTQAPDKQVTLSVYKETI